jgi:hypothetical protein
LNQGLKPGEGVQITLELDKTVRHNRLHLATSEQNFRQRVRIETSDDPKNWSTVREDGYIFDFSQGEHHVSVLTVDYPLSTRRYVRATVFGWNNVKSLESAWLTYRNDQPATRDTTAVIRPVPDIIDLGSAGLPYNEITFTVGAGFFHRAAEIDTSQDGKEWFTAGTGVLSRTKDEEQLTVGFPEKRDRYLRTRIYNGDDQPLVVESLTLTAFRRTVAFPAKDRGVYRVYYGNPEARQPSYDFGYVADAPLTKSTAVLKAEEMNPAYLPPSKPWTDTHPGILYATLGIAVIVMGAITVRFLIKVI